ncbi:MAG TPA: type II secretion system F family protein [Verrucomicrobiae bacterium]|nr:type II secretion system F family protein [Verrucomicrobiae bacterium]
MRFSSKNLAMFYYQLGTLIQAGLPIQSALTSTRSSAPRSMRRSVAELSAVVDQGTPLSEAMERCGKRFAPLDVHTIGMTERSGTLDVGLLSLSRYYETRAAARSNLIAGSLYPALMLTAAVFIIHVPALFLGAAGGKPYTTLDYLRDTVGPLGGLVLLGWLIMRLVRWSFTVPRLNVTLDRLLLAVPVFGRLRFDYALSQWVSSIRLTLAAGVGVVEALESASRTIPSPLIADAYKRAAPLIGSQLEVSQALASTGVFPDHVIQFWATGEKSGRLDEMLDRLARFYEERWRRSLDQVVTWLPRIAYALVAVFVIFQIFKTFNIYLNTYNAILGE